MVPVNNRLLAQILRPGTVYMMRHPCIPPGQPHFLVVVNHDPRNDDLLLLSVITSSVEKRKKYAAARGFPPGTIVEFGPEDYTELDHPSCIDCNTLLRMSATDFEREHRHARGKLDLPPPVLSRVVSGILASPAVSDHDKALVCPSSPTPRTTTPNPEEHQP